MSTSEKTRVGPKNHFNQALSESTNLTPRVEVSSLTPAEVDALLDTIVPTALAPNCTIMVQFADQQEADQAIEKVRDYCAGTDTITDTIYEGVRKRKYREVAMAAVAYYCCTETMIDKMLEREGIPKANNRADGAPRFRDFVRIPFNLKISTGWSTLELNKNAKDVALCARYVEACYDRLKASPTEFVKQPVDKLVKIIASYGNLDKFAPPKSHRPDTQEAHQNSQWARRHGTSQSATTSVFKTDEKDDAGIAVQPLRSESDNELSLPSMENGGGNSPIDKETASVDLIVDNIAAVAPSPEEVAKEKKNVWLKRFKEKMRNGPNLQTIALTNPPSDLVNMPAILLGEYNNGTFVQWTATNHRPYMSETDLTGFF